MRNFLDCTPAKKVGYFLAISLDTIAVQGARTVIHIFARIPSTPSVEKRDRIGSLPCLDE
jgi:hypothetical protein